MQCRGMQRTSLSLGCRRRRRRRRMCRWMQGWVEELVVVGSSEEGQQGMGRGGEGIRCRGWQQRGKGRGGMPSPVERMESAEEESVEESVEEGGKRGKEQEGDQDL